MQREVALAHRTRVGCSLFAPTAWLRQLLAISCGASPMGKEPISVGPEGAPPTNGDDERPTSDPSADAHRMLSVGGTQLKKDAVFGQDASPKKPPMPALGIEGKGYSGVDGERLGSPSARPSSQQRANGGSRLKTPPAHTPTPPAGAPSSIGFHRYSRSPSGSGRLHSPTAAQYTNGGGSPAIVSNVVLTLESPPTTSRRPNGSPLSPHRKPLGDRKKGVSKDREQQRNPHQEVATLAAQPLPELPDSVQRGGEEEIAWLRQQLQKAHQEAHAIHSAMVAQRHNQSLGEFYDTPDAADTPEPSPQLLRGHGTITSLLPPDQDAPSPTGTSRRRADRKRAPGAIVEQEERNGDELEGSELAQGQAPDTFAKSDEREQAACSHSPARCPPTLCMLSLRLIYVPVRCSRHSDETNTGRARDEASVRGSRGVRSDAGRGGYGARSDGGWC